MLFNSFSCGPAAAEKFGDSRMAVGGRGDQWRITRAVAVIGIGSISHEPRDNGGVPASDRSGQRVVARSVGRWRVHFGALGKQILGHVAVPQNSSQSEDRKTIRR